MYASAQSSEQRSVDVVVADPERMFDDTEYVSTRAEYVERNGDPWLKHKYEGFLPLAAITLALLGYAAWRYFRRR